MGSTASKGQPPSSGGPHWGCLHRRSHNKSHPEIQQVEEESSENQNQNRNHSLKVTTPPHIVNTNGPETFTASDFKIVKLKAIIEKRLTSIDEKSSAVLKYRTPHFRASAWVELPALESKQGLQIGWIQTCMSMQFVNQYGSEGVTSWEFPEIVLNKYKMISDADGKLYPWYGSKHEVQTVHGPSQPRGPVLVHMNDNFFPQVTWYVPHARYDRTPRLTHIYRKQKFYTFLVVKNLQSERYHVLKTILWGMELSIQVDPIGPLGQRAQLVGPLQQEEPLVLDSNPIELPDYACRPPNANNSQTLVWRPLVGDPDVIVPPSETTLNMDKYLKSTRHHRYKYVDHQLLRLHEA